LTILLGSFLVYRIKKETALMDWSRVRPEYFPVILSLGVLAFFSYTAIWYFLVSPLRRIPFRKLAELNLLAGYLSITLNSVLGGVVKAKYALPNWWQSIGVIALVTALEILPGGIVAVISGDLPVLPFLLLVLWALVHEDSLYPLVAFPFKLIGKDEWIRDFYIGWKTAKANKGAFARAAAAAFLQSIFLALALVVTGQAFGVSISLEKCLIAVAYSTVMGGIIGTPGGVGGNELGVMLAIGDVSTAATVAFVYKFFTQYIFAIAGAVPFYKTLRED
ncbi:MAG: flippase-like domain-containing protein, partial [Thermococcus sp.]|nr:flippase-like domain-containing protein [Thermococcus sp.]